MTHRFARPVRATTLALAAVCAAAHAQAFVNLGFEDAVISDPESIFQPWETALPGWQHSSGADTGSVYWRIPHLASTQIYWLKTADEPGWPSGFPFEGDHGVFFKSGLSSSFDPEPQWVQAYLAQTGTVDASARSLHFQALGPVQVTLGGTVLPLIDLGGNHLAADVSAFAGQTLELRFTDLTTRFEPGVHLDGIRFASSAVPEPEAGVLGLMGMAGLACLRVASSMRRKRLPASA